MKIKKIISLLLAAAATMVMLVTPAFADSTSSGSTDDTLKAKAQQIISKIIKPNMTDYDKELAIHDYIVKNAAYDHDAYANNTIPDVDYTAEGVLLNGTAVCEGYAEAFKYLMDMVNIPCMVVTGTAHSDLLIGDEGHAWNEAEINGSWYQVDVTWDDTDSDDVNAALCYTYFNVTDKVLSGDHDWEVSDYPVCNNDFVMSGNVIEKYLGTSSSVTIQNGVTGIGDRAFSNCSCIVSVTIPNSVTSIGDSAFSNCLNLASVTIPNSISKISKEAFARCSALTVVTIPSSVTSIEGFAFVDCKSLGSVTIPSSATDISEDALQGCTLLTAINVGSSNPNYSSPDGVFFDKSQSKLIQYPSKKAADSYTIPSSVTTIDANAFYGSTNLTSVTIPSSVTVIDDSVF